MNRQWIDVPRKAHVQNREINTNQLPGPLKETEGGRGAEETRGMKFLAEERDVQRKGTQKRPLEKACRQQCCERDDVAQRRSGSIDEVAPKRGYDRREEVIVEWNNDEQRFLLETRRRRLLYPTIKLFGTIPRGAGLFLLETAGTPFRCARYITVVAFGLIRVFLGFFWHTDPWFLQIKQCPVVCQLTQQYGGLFHVCNCTCLKYSGSFEGYPYFGAMPVANWVNGCTWFRPTQIQHCHTYLVNIGRVPVLSFISVFRFHCFSTMYLTACKSKQCNNYI